MQRENVDVAKKLLKHIRKGASVSEAAKKMGIPARTAYDKLHSPYFQSAMEIALNAVGLSDRKLAKTFKETLEANKPVVIDKEIHDYPDHPTRLKTAEIIVKLKGHFEDIAENEKANNISININFVSAETKPEAITINPEVDNAV